MAEPRDCFNLKGDWVVMAHNLDDAADVDQVGGPFSTQAEAFRDDAICHLESVLSSHHVEEKITRDGERSRFFVRVVEQEYVVQNPTDQQVVFIVKHKVPESWSVDSDPQPTSMDGSIAVFRLNAEPGQRIRLHVGMHRNYKINPE